MSVCLQTGRRKKDHIHVLSCYAQTRAASRNIKDEFFADLEQALASIPSDEPFILLGDLNARVGSRSDTDDTWEGVRGPHGYGESNDAGKELLTFLSTTEATVCNTWLRKNIHKQMWQHPKSKHWHCIDYAIMHQKDWRRCLDVTVKRGAECNTDHQLLCMKIKMLGTCHHRIVPTVRTRWFDVAKLARNGRPEEGPSEAPQWEAFQQQVADRASAAWPTEGSAEDKWEAMRSALLDLAEAVLGTESRYHPDWFRECADELEPILQCRNKLYTKWLATKRVEDQRRFRQARGEACRVMRDAKNRSFQEKTGRGREGTVWGEEGVEVCTH